MSNSERRLLTSWGAVGLMLCVVVSCSSRAASPRDCSATDLELVIVNAPARQGCSVGGRATSTLTYLESADGDGWVPDRLAVVLSNGVVSAPWALGSVDPNQEGNTRPGTFVSAFAAAEV